MSIYGDVTLLNKYGAGPCSFEGWNFIIGGTACRNEVTQLRSESCRTAHHIVDCAEWVDSEIIRGSLECQLPPCLIYLHFECLR